MINSAVSTSIQFVLLILFQVLILNHLEVGFGLYIMVYPLFIFNLPFNLKPTALMLVAFLIGIIIDSFSNTFGLHASSAVFMAYLRPMVFGWFTPKDSYSNSDSSPADSLENNWFFTAYSSLLLFHHAWFFLMESFKLNELGWILLKIILSVPCSFLVSLFIQNIFLRKRKS